MMQRGILKNPDLGICAETSIEASSDARATKAELMGWPRDKAAL